MSKNLRDSDEYKAEAARLKAKSDAVKGVVSSMGSLLFKILAITLVAVLLFIVISIFVNRKEASDRAEERAQRSQELGKVVEGRKSSVFCHRDLNKDICLDMYFVGDDAGHIVIRDDKGFHLYQPSRSGFLESADKDFSSDNPLDYATIYPKNLTGKPWLEAFELQSDLYKLKMPE